MKRHVSPGIIWAIYLLIGVYIIVTKYKSGTIFKFSSAYAVIVVGFLLCTIYTYYADRSKLKAMSITSFAFGMGFWIPLLNLISGLLAIYIGAKALRKIKKDASYGGKWFAIIGVILGVLIYLTYITGVGMCLFGYKEICKNIGLTFLA